MAAAVASLWHRSGAFMFGVTENTCDFGGPCPACVLQMMDVRMQQSIAHTHHRLSQSGYSLIEVLVGCALGGVLMAAALPQLPRMWSSFQLQNATFQVANDLRLARERALVTNGKGRIVFSSASYQLRRESPVGSGTYVNDGASIPLPSTASVSSNPVNPTFDARGLAPAAPYTITVSNGTSTKTITVSTVGRVVVN